MASLTATPRGVLTADGKLIAGSWYELELARLAHRAGVTASLAWVNQRARERKKLPSEDPENDVDGVIDRAIGDGHDSVRTDRAAVYLRREGGRLVARRVVPRMGEATKREMTAGTKLAEVMIAPESLPRLGEMLADQGACPICLHGKVSQIERLLRGGVGAARIARQFKVSRRDVLVHSRRHRSQR